MDESLAQVVQELAEAGGSITARSVDDWTAYEAAKRAGLVRFTGPAWELTGKGWRASGHKRPRSPVVMIVFGLIFLALAILAGGESLNLWNVLRAGPDVQPTPAPSRGWERS